MSQDAKGQMRSSRGQKHIKLDYSLNPQRSIIENLCLSDKLLILYRNYANFNHAKTRKMPKLEKKTRRPIFGYIDIGDKSMLATSCWRQSLNVSD